MLREMSFREFAMWRIRYTESPWGETRGDIRSAQICALIANVNRDVKERPKPFDMMDFMLFKAEFEKVGDDEEDDERDIVSDETKAWLYAMAKRTEAGN